MSAPGVRSVGILGGSFDPVHNGHVRLAQAVQTACGFDPLLIIPTKEPPHKDPYVIEQKHRLEMARLAFASVPGATLSLFEIESEGPSYAIRTIEHFTRANPGRSISFILGADAFHDLPKWYAFPDVLEACSYIVAARAGWDQQALDSPQSKLSLRLAQLAKSGLLREAPPEESGDGRFERIYLTRTGTRVCALNVELPEVSSTEIRLRMQLGESVDGLVPPAVATYLKSNALYGNGPAKH